MPNASAYVHTTDWAKPRNGAAAAQSRGKHSRLSRGAWLADLVALRKVVTLCFKCTARWSAKANHYHPFEAIPGWGTCVAECDGCRNESICTAFKAQES